MKHDSFATQLLVAFGCNLYSRVGSPDETIRAAIGVLNDAGFCARQVSRFYKTPAFPAGSGPEFVNAAAAFGFGGTAEAALGIVHDVEAQFGRKRTERWMARTLDIDLLALDDRVLPDPATHDRWRTLPPDQQMSLAPDRLILPHPRMQDRAFVLVPLADIAPDWRHPTLGRTVTEMLAALPASDLAEIRPIPS